MSKAWLCLVLMFSTVTVFSETNDSWDLRCKYSMQKDIVEDNKSDDYIEISKKVDITAVESAIKGKVASNCKLHRSLSMNNPLLNTYQIPYTACKDLKPKKIQKCEDLFKTYFKEVDIHNSAIVKAEAAFSKNSDCGASVSASERENEKESLPVQMIPIEVVKPNATVQ